MKQSAAERKLNILLTEVRACKVCAPVLPLGSRPLLAASAQSRVLIIGQAPGTAAHESGIPWNDRSGDRLRDWLGVGKETFYDATKVALMPMGFCYPGAGHGGDLAPRPECAPLWHEKLLKLMPKLGLTLYIGRYSQASYLTGQYETLTEAVQAWDEQLPNYLALPHPSPRNQMWMKRNVWFEADVLPALRGRVGKLLS